MNPTVVVGYDQSPAAKRAVVTAAQEASTRNATLVVVHAFEWVPPATPLMVTPPRLEEICRDAARLIVAEAAALVHERYPSVPTETRAIAGYAPAALTDAARDAELLVLGNRGLGGFKGLLLGSVSRRSLAKASCPVLVVHADEHTPTGTVIAAVDVDSPGADDILGFTFTEAARRQSAVHAMYVLDTWVLEYATDIEDVRGFIARATQEAGDRLAASLSPWEAKFPGVTVTHEILAGSPGGPLVARSPTADLLVLGALQRSPGHAGLQIGPVVPAVLPHAACPVAVVPVG